MDTKIIHIVLGKANPNKMNGVSKVVNELATYQTILGYDVRLWGVSNSLNHNYPERNYETELFLDEGRFRTNHAIKAKLKTMTQGTIFHIHGGFIPQFYYIAKSIIKAGFEYVYTPHGAYNALALERSKYKKKVFLKSFDQYIIKHAKCVHFIGQSEVDNGLKLFGDIPYSLIPNGQPMLSGNTEAMSQNETNGPIFGFMGRLDIQTKGLDLLINGFKDFLVEYDGRGELWVIGDGKALPVLKEMAQNLGINHVIKFKGCLFGLEKEMALKALDIFCLTSRNEGLPGVVLEAASYGLPSIVSEATNMGNYVRNYKAGWVLEANTINHISKTLKKGNDARFVGFGRAYQKHTINMLDAEFSWENIAKAHIKNYEK